MKRRKDSTARQMNLDDEIRRRREEVIRAAQPPKVAPVEIDVPDMYVFVGRWGRAWRSWQDADQTTQEEADLQRLCRSMDACDTLEDLCRRYAGEERSGILDVACFVVGRDIERRMNRPEGALPSPRR
jgi:hypothetical protein